MNFLRQFTAWAACFAIMPSAFAALTPPAHDPKESHRLANTKPSLPIASYLGTYESEVYGRATVELDGQGHLRITDTLDRNGTLEHWENDTFRYHDDGHGSFVQFIVDASHSVSAMQIDNTTIFWRTR